MKCQTCFVNSRRKLPEGIVCGGREGVGRVCVGVGAGGGSGKMTCSLFAIG